MFSIIQRAQDISSLITSTVFILSVLIVISSSIQLYLNDYKHIPGELSVKKSQNTLRFTRSFGGSSHKGKENVKLSFDLQTDLSPLFNWNTKQVFVYLVGEYDGLNEYKKTEGEVSKVVFWDRIITDKSNAVLNLKNTKSKYSVWDYYDELANRNATIRLDYNIQPYVGPLTWGSIDFDYDFIFPETAEAKQKRILREESELL